MGQYPGRLRDAHGVNWRARATFTIHTACSRQASICAARVSLGGMARCSRLCGCTRLGLLFGNVAFDQLGSQARRDRKNNQFLQHEKLHQL